MPCTTLSLSKGTLYVQDKVTGIGDESLAYFSLAENTLCPG